MPLIRAFANAAMIAVLWGRGAGDQASGFAELPRERTGGARAR